MQEVLIKSILNRKKKRDPWFLDEYTLNPYVGCSFNCQYCYIRGSKYGLNLGEGLAVRINAPEVLDRQLRYRVSKGQYGIIALASATDPYIPAESHYRMTRRLLEVILQHRFPVLILTKSSGVVRDIDLLKEISECALHAEDLRGRIPGAIVSFSISTLDEQVAATLEPGAPPPKERLAAMQACSKAGLYTGVNSIPTLPFISDSDEALDNLIAASKEHGAGFIHVGSLTLFGNGVADSRTLYRRFLERKFPELVPDYEKLYGESFFPSRHYQNSLNKRAERLCSQYDLKRSILEPVTV